MNKLCKPSQIITLAIGLLVPLHAFSQKVLKLEDAMAIALKNSPDIIRSELNMLISEENLKAQEAATKSNFAFEVTPISYSHRREIDDRSIWYTNERMGAFGNLIVTQPVVKTDGTLVLKNGFAYQDSYSKYDSLSNRSKVYSNNLLLSFTQPLFTYNKQKMQIERLRLALENTTLSYSILRLRLEQNVTVQFYQLYESIMSLRIAEEDFLNQQKSYEIIKSKVDAGLSPSAELYQAEVNLSTSESNLQNQRLMLENTKDNFRQYIGMPLNEDFSVEGDTLFNQVNVDLDVAVKNGLNTRMELKQRNIVMKDAEFGLIEARATNEFKADANLSFGISGDNARFSQIYYQPTQTPQVNLTLTIPIWDWGVRKARIRAAEASKQIEEINTQTERDNIELAIKQSYRRLQNLQMQIEIARKSETNAGLTYDINLDRYKTGDLTSKDLGQYQSQLSQARLNLVNRLIDYKLELLNMKIQSLWDFENSTSFVPKNLQSNVTSDPEKNKTNSK